MKRLAVYLMAGRDTPDLAEAAVEGGADLIEVGFPFSDPLADGPVIRRAAERALAEGMRTDRCLECLAAVRARVDVPLVPMTYASLLEAHGYEQFAADARAAGATASSSPTCRPVSAPSFAAYSWWHRRPPTSACASPRSRRTVGSTSSR